MERGPEKFVPFADSRYKESAGIFSGKCRRFLPTAAVTLLSRFSLNNGLWSGRSQMPVTRANGNSRDS